MSDPNAWVIRASELSSWAMARLANRTDRCGGYYKNDGGQTAQCTRPGKGPRSDFLNATRFAAHFAAECRDRLVGVHALGVDSRGKWLGIDIDAHDGTDADPDRNLRYALHLYAKLTALGFRVLLYESNGKGGYHLWVLFAECVPGPLLFAFARWLVRDHKGHGFAEAPETFPKQPQLTESTKYGNWLRVIGLHHTNHTHWARVYDGERWLEMDEAVEFVLALTGDSPGLIPPEAYPAQEAKPGTSCTAAPKGADWGATKPGQRFDDTADWRELLEDDGATLDRDRGGGVTEWTRPGKDDGLSGTVGYCKNLRGTTLLYVFSINWHGLEAGRTYTPFQFITVKRFGRLDAESCSQMAKELARSGSPQANLGSKAPEGEQENEPADEGERPDEGDTPEQPAGEKSGKQEEKKGGQRPAAEVMVALVRAAEVVLLHTPDGEGYAQVPVEGRLELYPVRSSSFRQWLTRLFYRDTGRPINAEAMATALGLLEAVAKFDGKECPVYLRVAPGPDGGYVLDLCDDAWRVVVIHPDGWEVADRSPVLFRRGPGVRPLSVPTQGGNLKELRGLLNLRDPDPANGRPHDSDWWLAVAWLCAAMRSHGPYPVLHLLGEQGTAKTTAGRILRRLIDPHKVDLRSQPKEERDLAVASRHGWMIGYDNLSRVDIWLSDALCRVATGGGFGTRTLYSNDEETVFDFVRPVIITSIEDVLTQPDLLDRSLPVELTPIPDDRRRTESRLWAEYEAARPGILGALLDVMAAALKQLPAVEAEGMGVPRMADFAIFGESVARVLGAEPGQFLKALADVRSGADQTALEGSPLALELFDWIRSAKTFEGTYSDLLAALNATAGDDAKKWKQWPANPRALGGQVKRIAPTFRRLGIEHQETRQGKKRTRIVTLTYTPPPESTPPPENVGGFASAPSADDATHRTVSGLGADEGGSASASAHRPPTGFASANGAGHGKADANGSGADEGRPQTPSAPNHQSSQGVCDEADEADAKSQAPSGWTLKAGRDGRPHAFAEEVDEVIG